MRHFISIVLIVLLSFSLFATDGFAKRFGGGRSIGMQRSISRAPSYHSPASFKKPLSSSKWFGPLAGLITGGLLASLFMGHGLGTGLLMWLVIAAIAFSIFNLLRKRNSAHSLVQESVNTSSYANQDPGLRGSLAHFGASGQPVSQPFAAQTDDQFVQASDSFLQEAKAKFIRLQAAYDQKNLNDIRTFTTPEMFSEIQLQLLDRGEAVNITEVVSLHAQLLAPERNNFAGEMNSVQFSGLIRENSNENPVSFNEIWNFCKVPAGDRGVGHPEDRNRWLVAGIQQN